MTAANTTKVPPLSPLAIIMFTLAAVGTLLAIPHVIFAAIGGWPPQFVTFHAVATVGFWGAAFHYRAHPPHTAAEDTEQSAAQKEIDDLERRLRNTDH